MIFCIFIASIQEIRGFGISLLFSDLYRNYYMIRLKLILVIIITFHSICVISQTSEIDSLINLLNEHNKEDTTKVNLLNKIAVAYLKSDDTKAEDFANNTIKLSDSLGYNKGKNAALYTIGNYYRSIREYNKAIYYYTKIELADPKVLDSNIFKNTLKYLGFLHCMTGDINEGIGYLTRLLDVNRKEGNKIELTSTYNNLGNAYEMLGETEVAIQQYKKSLEIRKEIGDKSEIADVYINLGYLFMKHDRIHESLEYYFDALNVYEELNSKSRIATVLNGIGGNYSKLNKDTLATQYYQRAKIIHEELDERTQLANCLSNLANLASVAGEYNIALKYYEHAYSIFTEYESKSKIGSVLRNISQLYYEQGEYKKALVYCKDALLIQKEVKNSAGIGTIYISMSNIYLKLKDFNKAEKYALQGLKIVKEYDILLEQKNAHHSLYEIYKLKNDYKEALNQHELLKIMDDSLFNEENVRKITGLEYKYQFEKEKEIIEIEQQKKDAIQTEELERQKLMRNSFIVGFILVLLLAAVIYYSLIQKRKTNRKLIEQNNIIKKQKEEKELLVKEMHHRVKNNLQIISSLFNLQMRSTDNPDTKSALVDGLNRVKSVALIHQLLYQTDDVINVDFEDFSTKLIDHITSFTNKPIEKSLEIPSRLQFDIKTTIPLGLIITELLTNAFKYAFERVDICVISIRLVSIKNNKYLLEVKDNGSGLPEEFDLNNSKNLGLRLVRTLTKQLSGELEYIFDNGSKFSLTFSKIT